MLETRGAHGNFDSLNLVTGCYVFQLRSSLRTMPTEATPRGDTPSSASRELTRMRHRLDALESEKRDAERSARRAVAAEVCVRSDWGGGDGT